MNRDITMGKLDQLKGKVKQSVGETLGNENLANQGTADQIKGAVQEAWGNTKDAAQAVSDDARTHGTIQMRDVRAKIASTAQNVKNAVSVKAVEIKAEHKRSA